jgi:hypothetical protein
MRRGLMAGCSRNLARAAVASLIGASAVTLHAATVSVISPVVVVSWFTSSDSSRVEQLDLLVLWRGSAGWFMHPGGAGGGGGISGPHYTWIQYGDVRLTLDFDQSKRIVVVQGRTIELGADNVVFVDDVDAKSGQRVIRTLSIPRAMPGSAGQIGPLLQKSPEIMSYLRCDAAAVRDADREYLSRLCLQNVGAAK